MIYSKGNSIQAGDVSRWCPICGSDMDSNPVPNSYHHSCGFTIKNNFDGTYDIIGECGVAVPTTETLTVLEVL